MFGFLRRKPRRHIFAFTLNGRTVHRDPVKVRQRLTDANPKWAELVDAVARSAKPLPPNLQAAPELVKQRQEAAESAATDLAEIVAKAFEVPPLTDDGEGMTQNELLGVMAEYIAWCAEVMRAARPKANSPAATGLSPAGV